jgi:hypothetical protein
VGRILLSVYLRVYEASPREGTHPLNGRTATELEAIAGEQRENARAEGRSRRLLLTEIHQAYNLPGSVEGFIRAHRRHAHDDIQEAERRLRLKACRCVAKACDRYFAGILRNVAEENERRRRRERKQKIYRARQWEERRKMREEEARRNSILKNQPENILEEGLNMVSYHWIPEEGVLLADGSGLGTWRIREALESMKSQDPYTVQDRAVAVWKGWVIKNSTDSGKVAKVRKAFERILRPFFIPPPSTENLVKYNLNIRPQIENRLSVRGPDLRNLEAGCWG